MRPEMANKKPSHCNSIIHRQCINETLPLTISSLSLARLFARRRLAGHAPILIIQKKMNMKERSREAIQRYRKKNSHAKSVQLYTHTIKDKKISKIKIKLAG